MTFNIILQVIILGRIQPYSISSQRRFEYFSETTLMLVMYHLICFTPFVPDLKVRFQLGYSVCGVICIYLAVAFFLLLKETYRNARMKYRIRKAKKEHDK